MSLVDDARKAERFGLEEAQQAGARFDAAVVDIGVVIMAAPCSRRSSHRLQSAGARTTLAGSRFDDGHYSPPVSAAHAPTRAHHFRCGQFGGRRRPIRRRPRVRWHVDETNARPVKALALPAASSTTERRVPRLRLVDC
jgi:hypothetical protein